MQSGDLGDMPASTTRIPGWIGSSVSKAARNPELVAYKLKTNAYKFSWLIIPLSVPFVWLLFPFSRRFRLYDHTVFVTYSLCFMSLLVVAGLLFGALGMTSIAGLLWLLPPFHMYRQLKGAYALGRRGALWRTVLLTAVRDDRHGPVLGRAGRRRDVRLGAGQGNLRARMRVIASVMSILRALGGGMAASPFMNSSLSMRLLALRRAIARLVARP